jgi:hypothetical protein
MAYNGLNNTRRHFKTLPTHSTTASPQGHNTLIASGGVSGSSRLSFTHYMRLQHEFYLQSKKGCGADD